MPWQSRHRQHSKRGVDGRVDCHAADRERQTVQSVSVERPYLDAWEEGFYFGPTSDRKGQVVSCRGESSFRSSEAKLNESFA